MSKRPKVYLAGEMVCADRAHGCKPDVCGQSIMAPWRVEMGGFLKKAGITPLCPEDMTEGDHCGIDWASTTAADLAAVKASDAVFAYFTKSDRDGTISEVAYASAHGIPVIILDDTKTLSGFVHALPHVLSVTTMDAAQKRVVGAAWWSALTPIERLMQKALHAAHIPHLLQWPVGTYRADFFIEPNTVIECDGVSYHTRADAVIRDKQRDRWFLENGYAVLRFSTPELTDDMPGCIAQIKRVLAAR